MGEQNKSEIKIIFLTVFLYLVGFGVIIPLLPILSRDLGASSLELGLLMAIYSLAQFIFAPFWGKLSDRIGRRPVLVGCLALEVLSYIVFAFARSIEGLILARGMAGFFGASLSTASAAISDVTTEKERSKGMALIGAAFGLGFIVGPGLGGGLATLAHHISSEPFFASTFTLLCVAGLCFLNFLFALRFFRETRVEMKGPQADNAGQKPGFVKVGMGGLFERLKLMTAALRRPVVGPLVFVFLLASTAMSSMESTLALFVADVYGWGLQEVSWGFVYIGVLSTFNQGFLVRKLLPRWGERRVLWTGALLLSFSFVLIGFSYHLGLLFVAMTMLGFGHSMLNPAVMGSVSLLSPADGQGQAMGTTQGFAALGRILGPLLGGWAYGAIGLSAPYFISGVLGFVAVAVIAVLGTKIPSAAKG